MANAPQTQLTSSAEAGEGLSIRRYFTDGRDPSVRCDRVGDPRRADRSRRPDLLRAARRRVSRELVAERDQHRRSEVLPGPARFADAGALGQADDRPRRRHDRRLGRRTRLLRLRRGRRDLRARADAHPAAPDGGVQLAGVVQRRVRGEPAMLGLLHPVGGGRHGVDPRLEYQGGQHLPRRFGVGDQPVEDPRLQRAAGQGRHRLGPGQLHARRRCVGGHDQVRRQDPSRREDGRARRRSPRHPRLHLVQGQGGGQGRRAARRRL